MDRHRRKSCVTLANYLWTPAVVRLQGSTGGTSATSECLRFLPFGWTEADFAMEVEWCCHCIIVASSNERVLWQLDQKIPLRPSPDFVRVELNRGYRQTEKPVHPASTVVEQMDHLQLDINLGLKVVSGGLFVSSGAGTHPDRVLDNYELIVVRKGTLSIWEDDVRFDVPAGHALLLHAGRRHRGAEPFGADLSFYWIHFVPSLSSSQEHRLEIPQLTRVQRLACVAELFHRFLDDQEARQLDPLYSALLLAQILCEVGRQKPQAVPVRGSALVGRAEEYVTRHLAEKLSTADVARALRINPDYLNRLFRATHQVTFTEYIHRRKLTDAAGMLRDTTDAVAEIASSCGYRSAGHFRRIFARYHGVAPGEYRRLMARAFVNAR
jgi:AraC-like DNA-binding protein